MSNRLSRAYVLVCRRRCIDRPNTSVKRVQLSKQWKICRKGDRDREIVCAIFPNLLRSENYQTVWEVTLCGVSVLPCTGWNKRTGTGGYLRPILKMSAYDDFLRDKHVKFFMRCIQVLPGRYSSLDTSR